jgi:hypothetical protein
MIKPELIDLLQMIKDALLEAKLPPTLEEAINQLKATDEDCKDESCGELIKKNI